MAKTHPEGWRGGQMAAGKPVPERGRLGLWTRVMCFAFASTAVGTGVWLGFASEEADRINAGQVVPAGVHAGSWTGGLLFLLGLVAMVTEAVRQGWKHGRLLARVASALGLGLLAIVLGFFGLLVVVHLAFA